MPKTVEESLLGDHSDQWLEADCPEIKRLKVGHVTVVRIGVSYPGPEGPALCCNSV